MSGPTERGAVLDMAWAVRGGAVRLSLHLAEPLGTYEVSRLGKVVEGIESLVSVIDALTDTPRVAAPPGAPLPPPEAAGAVE